MLARFSDWLLRVSTGRVVLAAMSLFLLFTALVLPSQTTGGETGAPDTTFLYSARDLYHMAEAYGPVGRQAYIKARFTFDLVWPLVYSAFLCTATSYVSQRAFARDGWLQRANLIPVLGTLFDYLENLSTSLVMLRFPTPTVVIDAVAPLFSATKWALIGASFVLLLASGLMMVSRRRRGSRNTT